MTPWARFVAGEPLSDAEARELLAALEADPGLRREAVEDYATHGLLRAAARVGRDAEAFAAAVERYAAKEREGTRFVRVVQARLAEEGGRRRPTRRRSGRTARPGGPLWIWGLAAGAAFAILTAWSMRPAPAPKGTPDRAVVRETTPLPPPVPPPRPEPPRDLPLPSPAPAKDPGPFVPPSPPAPLPAPPPPAVEKKEPSPPTAVAVAHVEGGPVLVAGDGYEARAAAVVVYADGTRLDLGPGTVTRDYQDREGKRLAIEKGVVRAAVASQPAGRPMVFVTPHGEATVLGTVLRLEVAASTRLEVEEGKVRLRADGTDALVTAGHFAVAGPGVALRARPVPANALAAVLAEGGQATVNFGPENVPAPPGVLNDAGAEFDERRGYGWLLPNDEILDPAEGRRPRRRAGVRADRAAAEPLKATRVTAGSRSRVETWTARVPDGLYALTICVGDDGPGVHGPHHVEVQGTRVIDARFTRSGEHLEIKDIPVRVRGGPLVMKVGGHGRARGDEDGTSDTVLNYLVLRRIR